MKKTMFPGFVFLLVVFCVFMLSVSNNVLAQDDFYIYLPFVSRDPSSGATEYKIAFESARDGNYEIYVMNADGSGQTRLTNSEGIDQRPVWSP